MEVRVLWAAASAAPHAGTRPGPTSNEVLSHLFAYVPITLAVLLVITALTAAYAAILTARALRRRRSLVALPTPTFAPTPEEMARFASAVSSSRCPGLAGVLSRRGEAVRFRVSRNGAGEVTQEVSATPRVLAMLEGAVMSGVDLRPVDDVAPSEAGPKLRRYRVEMRLHRDASHALATLELEPDPLAPVCQALAAMGEYESAELVLDLLPLKADAKRPMLRRAMRQEGKRGGGRGGGWQKELAEVAGVKGGKAEPGWFGLTEGEGGFLRSRESRIASIEDRADDKRRHEKLSSAEPAFRAQVLIVACAPTKARARELARALAATMHQWRDRNRWRPTGADLAVGQFGGAQSSGRRAWFDRRLATGLFWPRSKSVVVTAEISGLMKPPTATNPCASVARSGGLIPPAPPSLPTYERGQGLIPLGRITERGVTRVVGTPLDGLLFDLSMGRTRFGKTETALGRFLAAVEAGAGACYIDPHADAAAVARRYLLPYASRVMDLDMSRTTGNFAGLNLLCMKPLGLTPLGPDEVGIIAGTVAGAFAAVNDWDASRNGRALNLVTQGVSALCELNLVLPAELQTTIFELPPLFTDPRWRDAVLPFVSRHSREFLTDRLSTQSGGKEATSPVTNLVDNLRRARQVAAVLGQPQTTFDLRRAMDRRSIVLMCPPSGSKSAELVHALLLFELRRAAGSRITLPESQRHPFHVWADEMQVADHGAGSDLLRQFLRECGKWGLRFHGATQQPTSLTDETLTTFLTNGYMVCANTLGRKDAMVLVNEWDKAVEPTVLTRMPKYSYLCALTHDDAPRPPFLVRGMSVRELWGEPGSDADLAALDRAVDANMARRAVGDVVDEIDERASAIVRWFATHPHAAVSPARPALVVVPSVRRRARVDRMEGQTMLGDEREGRDG